MANKRTLKRREQRMNMNPLPQMVPTSIGLNSFVALQKTASAIAAKQIQLETNMNTNQISEEKRYLLSRLGDARTSKVWKAREHFNLEPDNRPGTYAEMRERLLAGKFTLPKDPGEDEPVNRFVSLDYLLWKDPERKPDRKGYEKAVEKLDEQKIKTADLIMVKSLDDGLKALQDFEAHTVH